MKWKLSALRGSLAGGEIPIRRFPFSIGRVHSCDLCERDLRVSRQHCKLIEHDDTIEVIDTSSRNGVYVNGIRIAHKKQIMPGDCIRVGGAMYCLGTMGMLTRCNDGAEETVTSQSPASV